MVEAEPFVRYTTLLASAHARPPTRWLGALAMSIASLAQFASKRSGRLNRPRSRQSECAARSPEGCQTRAAPQPGGLLNKSGPAARRAAKQERQGGRDAARPRGRYGALETARRATSVLGAAGLLSVATVAPAVGFGPAAVRNTSPQRTLSPVREQWPIYYPRIAHRDAARAPKATKAARLQRAFLDLHTGMSYQRAAAVAQAVEDLNPHSAQAHYNTACVMARLFRLEESLGALEQAVECGWRDRAHTELDTDLAPIRRSARFLELVDRMEHLAALELAEKKPTPYPPLPPTPPTPSRLSPVLPLLRHHHGRPSGSSSGGPGPPADGSWGPRRLQPKSRSPHVSADPG